MQFKAIGLAAVAFLWACCTARSAEISWVNASGGNWSAPENWDLQRVPEPGDAVRITTPGTYKVTLTDAITIDSLLVGADGGEVTLANGGKNMSLASESVIAVGGELELSGGTVWASSDLIVSGQMTWTGGVMAGFGRTIIAPGATATLSGSGVGLDSGRLLVNGGILRWDEGHIDLNAGPDGGAGRIENARDGVMEIQPRGRWMWTTGADVTQEPRASFHNAGIVRQTGGKALITVPFANVGTVAVQGGTLLITEVGVNRGALVAEVGATIKIEELAFEEGSSFAGDGTFEFVGTCAFNVDQTIPVARMTLGQVTGAGNITINRELTWTGGVMQGPGRTVIAPGAALVISGTGTKGLDSGRVLENRGTITLNAAFDLNALEGGGSGRIENTEKGLVNIASGSVRLTPFQDRNDEPLPSFVNAGRVKRVSGPGSSVFAPFINRGNVEVAAGTLRFRGGGANFGLMAAAAGATNAFETFSFESGSLLAGEGIHLFDAGVQTFNVDQVLAHAKLTGGQWAGPGKVTVAGSLLWSGGVMAGAGPTVVAPGATMVIDGDVALDSGRILENRGQIEWRSGNIDFNGLPTGGSGEIENGSVGVISITAESASILRSNHVDLGNASAARFTNNGIIQRTAGTGVILLAVDALNSGSIEAGAGVVRIRGGGSNHGRLHAARHGTIAVETFSFGSGSVLQGEGLFLFDAGVQTFAVAQTIPNAQLTGGQINGPGELTVLNSLRWSGGLIAGEGKTVIAAGAVCLLEGGADKELDSGRVLENHGELVWTGGNINLNGLNTGGSGRIANMVSSKFDVRVATGTVSARSYADVATDPLPSVTNQGVLKRSPSQARAVFAVPLSNSGTLELQQGGLVANGALTLSPSGAVRIGFGRALGVAAHGTLAVTGSVELNGTLEVTTADALAATEGNEFSIVSAAGGRSGMFTALRGAALGGDLCFNPIYEAQAVKLKVQSARARVQPLTAPGELRIEGIVGRSYRIDASTTLEDLGWVTLQSDIIPASGILEFFDPEAINHRHRFYRAIFEGN